MSRHLSRRKFVFSGVWGASSALVPLVAQSCKLRSNPDRYRAFADDNAVPNSAAIEQFLASFGPIKKTSSAATSFSGDEPVIAHSAVRDKVLKAEEVSTEPEEFDVIIIGGGMSGLAAAYRLMVNAKEEGRALRLAVLENASQFGGNSKGEQWHGIKFSIGAAYLVQTAAGDPLYDSFYGPLGIDKLWRESGEDPILLNNQLKRGFWDGATLPPSDDDGARVFRKAKEFLEQLSGATDGFPNIPILPGSVASEEQQWANIARYDQQSLLEYMTANFPYKNSGMLHPHMKALIEHYCWSSFGGSSAEISAAAGLNFLAGEFIGIAGLPGGNARMIQELLVHLIRLGVSPKDLRAQQLVTKVAVDPSGNGVHVFAISTHESQHTATSSPAKHYKAKYCVMACPKFIAAHILDGMPAAHRSFIKDEMSWRAYMVANALFEEGIDTAREEMEFLDLYLLGDGTTIVGEVPRSGSETSASSFAERFKAEAQKQGATDLLQSHWSQQRTDSPERLSGNDLRRSVLTFYRAFPYDSARKEIIPYAGPATPRGDEYRRKDKEIFKNFQEQFRRQVRELAREVFRLRSEPVDLRIARWGHPLVLAKKGLYQRGKLGIFQDPFKGRVYYCNQDNWALPAIETCLYESLRVAFLLGEKLRGNF